LIRLPAALAVTAIIVAAPFPTGRVRADTATDYSLTIYSRSQPGAVDPSLYRPAGRRQPGSVPGYAVVRQTQAADLAQGASQLRVQDVASLIDPTTVSIRLLDDQKDTMRVLEQNFEFDLVSSAKLLDRYLNREITVTRDGAGGDTQVTGTLLSTDGGLVLRQAGGGVQIVNGYRDIKLPELPGGLITKPTLVWHVQSATAGKRKLQISYQTDGMTWWTDYNATLKGDDKGRCMLDLNAWVSIVNQSGAGFPDAHLKLIAGDVQRIVGAGQRVMMEAAPVAKAPGPPGFQEKPFFEYHLYTLPGRTSLPDNSTKQLELFPAARGVSCSKEYVYGAPPAYPPYQSKPLTNRNPGWLTADHVAVFLTFRNDEKSGLGMPLPAGRLRINKEDPTDGSLEFIGEDVIDHTPRDENVRVGLGNAFDIVAERKQTDFRLDTSAKTMDESFEIKIRNHKETPVTVKINEVMYRWVDWEIVKSSRNFKKRDARSVQIPVTVEPGAEATVTYDVRYSW
jgi:hypothetical protein